MLVRLVCPVVGLQRKSPGALTLFDEPFCEDNELDGGFAFLRDGGFLVFRGNQLFIAL